MIFYWIFKTPIEKIICDNLEKNGYCVILQQLIDQKIQIILLSNHYILCFIYLTSSPRSNIKNMQVDIFLSNNLEDPSSDSMCRRRRVGLSLSGVKKIHFSSIILRDFRRYLYFLKECIVCGPCLFKFILNVNFHLEFWFALFSEVSLMMHTTSHTLVDSAWVFVEKKACFQLIETRLV